MYFNSHKNISFTGENPEIVGEVHGWCLTVLIGQILLYDNHNIKITGTLISLLED